MMRKIIVRKGHRTTGGETVRFIAVCLMFLWLCAVGTDVCKGEESHGRNMEAVLVLDTSGSMKHTDLENMSAQAAGLFLDMMKQQGSFAGVLAFHDTEDLVSPLQKIDDLSIREELKEKIRNLTRDGDTDIGSAALHAVNMFQNMSEDDTDRIIVCFTDGRIDLPKAEDQEKAENESYQQAMEAARLAKERNIRLCMVGLDSDQVEEQYRPDREFCEKLANESEGTFYYIQSADELPVVFDQIFADFIDVQEQYAGEMSLSEEDGNGEFSVIIPNGSVLEANIILLTDSSLDEIRCDGPKSDTDQIYISKNNRYTLVKLMQPYPGEWTIHASGQYGGNVHVSLLFNYEIELAASVEEDEEGNAQVNAWFVRQGEKLDDKELYRQFTCSLTVKDPDMEGQEESCQAVLTDDGYTCHVPVWPGHRVLIDIQADSKQLTRNCETLAFTSSRSDDIIVRRFPEKIQIDSFFAKDAFYQIDLAEYFAAWDGSMLTWNVENAEHDCLETSLEDSHLVIKGTACTKDSVIGIKVSDQYGKTVQTEILVSVSIQFQKLYPIFALFGVLIAGLICILMFLRRRRMSGYLFLELHGDSVHESINNRKVCVSLQDYKRKSALNNICPEWSRDVPAFDKIYVSAGNKGIRIRCKKQAARMTDCYGHEVSVLHLLDGDTFELDIKKQGVNVKMSGYFSLYPENDV